MDKVAAPGRLTDHGITTIQFVTASGLALILFALTANLVVVQYGRGAVQSALDQGVRAASVAGSETECEQRVADVLRQLLGGRMGDAVVTDCHVLGDTALATADVVFPSWTPLTPDFTFTLRARATTEGELP